MEVGQEIRDRLDPHVGLGEDEAAVLEMLQRDAEGVISFQGIRRSLRMHQEKLSRILRRLERYGLVDRMYDGYRLSEKARGLIGGKRAADNYIPLVEMVLEEVGSILAGVASLRGRWAGEFRWLGYRVDDGGHVLEWVSNSRPISLRLRLNGRRLIIEADAKTEEDRQHALRGAFAIVRKAYELALGKMGDDRLKAMWLTPPSKFYWM